MPLMDHRSAPRGDVANSPLVSADEEHTIASREFALECRNLARSIAKFMEQYRLQAVLKNGVSYRVHRVTWGVPCRGGTCMFPDKRIVLLRNNRIINNERREFTCDGGIKHEANHCKYIAPDISTTQPFAQLAGFDELSKFLDDAEELMENCRTQVKSNASRLRSRASQAKTLRQMADDATREAM